MILLNSTRPIATRLFVHLCVCLHFCQTVLAKGGGRGGSSSSSGSRGSSSSSSGGVAAYGHGHRGSGGGGSCGRGCRIVLYSILGIVTGFVLLFCAWCLAARNKKHRDFDQAVEKAEQEVLADAKPPPAGNTHRPPIHFGMALFSGTYLDSTHADGTRPLKCSGHFEFQEIPTSKDDAAKTKNTNVNCRSITGKGVDQDGLFTILRGKVSIWTGKAYWIESSKRQGLVTGTFHWDPSSYAVTFSGDITCNNKATGTYTNLTVTPNDTQKDVNLVSNAVSQAIPESPRYSHPSHPTPYPSNPGSVARSTGYTAATTDTSVTSGVPSIFTRSSEQTSATPVSPPAYLSMPAPAAPSRQEEPAYLSTPAPPPPSSTRGKDYSGVPSIFRPPP